MAVSGVVGTAYLAHEVGRRIGQEQVLGAQSDDFTSFRYWAKYHWRHYIPVVLAGATTITFIIGGNKISRSRTAAITAAYSLTERAFSEYKEKVQEKLGERKEKTFQDELAQDRVRQIPTGPEVVLVGKGTIMCVELHTGRLFLADMETIKRAEVEINDRLIRCDYASLAEFHTQIGIPTTQNAGDFGWTHERGLLKLEITTTLSDRDIPCIAFGYNYLQAL
jgi:hypothetical protein